MTDLEFYFKSLHPLLIEATLRVALERLQYNNDDIALGIEAFRMWTSLPIEPNGISLYSIFSPLCVREIWEELRSIFKGKEETTPLGRGFEVLTDLALTFVSCPASEAECERYISKQKLIITKNMQNINNDYMQALWMLYSHRLQVAAALSDDNQ